MSVNFKMKTVVRCSALGLLWLGSVCLMTPAIQAASLIGNLPLWFESSNPGQFTARGQGAQFTISQDGAAFVLQKPSGASSACTMRLVSASPEPEIAGQQPLSGKINYLTGNQPQNWFVGRQTFGQVQLRDVYPGIDVVFYGNQNDLEYDFNLAAGRSPAQIALQFDGAKKISVAADGSLVIKLAAGEIVHRAPVAFQIINGVRHDVAAHFKLLSPNTVGFALGEFNHSAPLVIDPVLSYSTYFGGYYGESANAIAVSPVDGSIYVAGQTFSSRISNGIPLVTASAYQTNYSGGKVSGDAFIARFDSTGTNLIFATYLGGSGNDGVQALTVDASGNAFLAGYTDSTNFPTKNALYDHINSSWIKQLKGYTIDAFVAELTPDGSDLIYSTYLGGNSMDAVYGLALDSNDNAYVTGYTYSTNFPVTADAFQSKRGFTNSIYFNANAFVSVIGAGGSNLIYSTYLGGTNLDMGRAIAFNNNRLFVAGYTTSTNFPATNHLAGFDLLNGNTRTNKNVVYYRDAFVTAFDASTTNFPVLYSTLLGGTNNDVANGIAADSAGNAYVVGYTMSTNFPYTTSNVLYLNPGYVYTNDFKKHPQLATNAFLTQITWNGTNPAIGFSSIFGGKGVDVANGVTLDASGNIYIVGSVSSTNFPVTTNVIYPPMTATNNSIKKRGAKLSDAFVMILNSDASSLLFSAYLGGRDNDFGNAIAVDTTGNAYIAGQTQSTNFPTVTPWQSHRIGTNDMFIAKISPDEMIPLSIIPVSTATTGLRSLTTPNQPHRIMLRWRASAANYQLESTTDMSHPNWQPVGQTPAASNGWNQVEVPATNESQFFRLRRP